MRLMALLLLAALAGDLACAHVTSDPAEAAPAQDPVSFGPEESASPQETATDPKSSGMGQRTSRVFLPGQGLNTLKSMIERSLSLARKAFEEAERRLNERIQGGKEIIENGADFLQELRNRFDPNNNWV